MNELLKLGQKAREASQELKHASSAKKDAALRLAAQRLREQTEAILRANAQDRAENDDLNAAQQDRLTLTPTRIEAMAAGLETIALLPDPVGQDIKSWQVENGLRFVRTRVPIGVIGIIYESRPNVTIDAAALCLKSGNACILRPGSESFHSANALAALFRSALKEAGLPQDSVQMIPSTDRSHVRHLLQMDEHVDLIIPRGGESLIRQVKADSRVPVLAHLSGNCHTFVDESADEQMAVSIVLNAKMRRTGICGATETLLLHKGCLAKQARPILQKLLAAGCELRCEQDLRDAFADLPLVAAQEEDWSTEYLDSILAVKLVEDTGQAIAHIARYGSGHTESIVTQSDENAALFLSSVDSAIVLHNASTQFADGGAFGMGAEIGIATGRLHARGPVGLEELTSYKTIVYGNGQVRPL